jgi:hypothetical protein
MHFRLGVVPGTRTNAACRLGTSGYVALVRMSSAMARHRRSHLCPGPAAGCDRPTALRSARTRRNARWPGDGPALIHDQPRELETGTRVSTTLTWDTKTSWCWSRFLVSSTPRPDVFAFQDHSDCVVTQAQPTCPISTPLEHAVQSIRSVVPSGERRRVRTGRPLQGSPPRGERRTRHRRRPL